MMRQTGGLAVGEISTRSSPFCLAIATACGGGMMLDQDSDEPLETAENRPVDDDRPVLGVVRAGVLQVEVFRLHVVELDRCALPFAADRVGHVEVDLRTVKRTVARVDGVIGR